MAGITLEQAQQQLDAFLAASLAVAKNQSYEIDGRKFTRADLAHIQAQITFWDNYVKRLTAAQTRRGPRVRYGVVRGRY